MSFSNIWMKWILRNLRYSCAILVAALTVILSEHIALATDLSSLSGSRQPTPQTVQLPAGGTCSITSGPAGTQPGQALSSAPACDTSTLEVSIRQGKVKLELKGDGKTTSRVGVTLTNHSQSPLRVLIPKYQFFVPDVSSFQTMMCTDSRVIDVAPGSTATAEIPTVCASAKTVKPPPAEGVSYLPGPHPDPALGSTAVGILEASSQLAQSNCFDTVPIPKERCHSTITQLAIWKEAGSRTPDPADDVTGPVIKQDLLQAAQIDEKELTRKQRDNVDKGVASIFAAVDLTLKQAHDTQIAQVPAAGALGTKPGAVPVAKPGQGGSTTKDGGMQQIEEPTLDLKEKPERESVMQYLDSEQPSTASPRPTETSPEYDSVLQYLNEEQPSTPSMPPTQASSGDPTDWFSYSGGTDQSNSPEPFYDTVYGTGRRIVDLSHAATVVFRNPSVTHYHIRGQFQLPWCFNADLNDFVVIQLTDELPTLESRDGSLTPRLTPAGDEYEVLEDLRIGLSGQYRRVGEVIEDISTDGAGTYFLANPQPTENDPAIGTAPRNFERPLRSYFAVELTPVKRFSRAFMLEQHWAFTRISPRLNSDVLIFCSSQKQAMRRQEIRHWASKQVNAAFPNGVLFPSDVLEDLYGSDDERTILWKPGSRLRF